MNTSNWGTQRLMIWKGNLVPMKYPTLFQFLGRVHHVQIRHLMRYRPRQQEVWLIVSWKNWAPRNQHIPIPFGIFESMIFPNFPRWDMWSFPGGKGSTDICSQLGWYPFWIFPYTNGSLRQNLTSTSWRLKLEISRAKWTLFMFLSREWYKDQVLLVFATAREKVGTPIWAKLSTQRAIMPCLSVFAKEGQGGPRFAAPFCCIIIHAREGWKGPIVPQWRSGKRSSASSLRPQCQTIREKRNFQGIFRRFLLRNHQWHEEFFSENLDN